ncbi:uncharacterized protein N7482_009184 [Penicillium canariense]|uniref:Uncharacterized protein n=1 Tax=Penicillium canariense TaxID=189055 RepID=A0A9W9LEJ0_9EURO|nr:uncharacterized protein N7482_009184 [Penicillium canariense]KAJ5152706.1 hypothetical protein N7482_009184 [Penicillium canariense]
MLIYASHSGSIGLGQKSGLKNRSGKTTRSIAPGSLGYQTSGLPSYLSSIDDPAQKSVPSPIKVPTGERCRNLATTTGGNRRDHLGSTGLVREECSIPRPVEQPQYVDEHSWTAVLPDLQDGSDSTPKQNQQEVWRHTWGED